jgi:SNF2 family DNA or RNA helicase
LSDSFESYYQAVRRCWRFGQRNPVTVHIIISDAEGAVKANIERKQADAQRMTNEMVKYTKDILRKEIHGTERMSDNYIPTEEMILPEWMKGAA